MSARDSDSHRQPKHRSRRFRRRTVRIEVDYLSPGGGLEREYATTLGAGGLFIESEQPLPATTRIKLGFCLPGRDQRHEIEGRVVWVTNPARPGESPRRAGMGIQFSDRVAEARLAHDLEDWEPTPRADPGEAT